MSLTGSILEYLPPYVPKSDIKIDEEYEFVENSSSVPKTVYKISKGPVKQLDQCTATVSGNRKDLVVGQEVEIRDTTGDGQYDSIAFIDSEILPDVGTEFEATYVAEPIISRYTGAYTDDINSLGEKIDQSIDSKYIDTASGRELDEIGAVYRDIGRRLGRDDEEYRSFLRSIVRTFEATGTKSGIEFVSSAVLELDREDIEVEEYFEETAFSVRAKHPDVPVSTSSLNYLLDLVSPTGVDLYDAVILYDNNIVGFDGKIPSVEDGEFFLGFNGKIPSVEDGEFFLGFNGKIPSVEDEEFSLGLSTDGFESREITFGLGSGALNSDRTLGSQLETIRATTEIGVVGKEAELSQSEYDVGFTSSFDTTKEYVGGLSTGILSSGDELQ